MVHFARRERSQDLKVLLWISGTTSGDHGLSQIALLQLFNDVTSDPPQPRSLLHRSSPLLIGSEIPPEIFTLNRVPIDSTFLSALLIPEEIGLLSSQLFVRLLVTMGFMPRSLV
uniref:(northern house mosquito) hypothetical protein n=1 Tax=Culex pipiens TaxID=7175 RepID=A0A8D8BNH4_CULPI